MSYTLNYAHAKEKFDEVVDSEGCVNCAGVCNSRFRLESRTVVSLHGIRVFVFVCMYVCARARVAPARSHFCACDSPSPQV